MPDINIAFIGEDKVSKTMKGIGRNFSKMGKAVAGVGLAAGGVALGGIVALTAGISASVKEGAAFSKQMSNVGAISGASAKDLADLEKQAKSLGRTTAFSGLEAAEGMQFLAQAGFETTDIMAAMPGVLDLAAASGADLGRSADIVSNVMSGFGADAKETGRFVDVLTKTFTTSNVNLDQLGESMKFAAPVAKSLGQEFEVTAAAVGFLGNAGLQGATAGEKMRSIFSRLAGPTEKAKEVMAELGVSTFDARGEMLPFPNILKQIETATAGMSTEQKNAALSTLFSMENVGAFNILLAEGSDALTGYAAELGSSVGIASQVAGKQLDNLSGDVTLFQSAISGVKIQVFQALEPLLRRIVQAATDFAGKVPDILAGLDFDAIGNKLSDLFNNTLLPAFTSIFNLARLLATGDFTGGIFGLAEDSGIIDFLFKLRDAFTTKIPAAISFLGNAFNTILVPAFQAGSSFIQTTLLPILSDFGVFIQQNLPNAIQVATQMFQKFTSDILPVLLSFITQSIQAFQNFRDKALAWIMKFAKKARPLIETFMERFQEVWTQAGPIVTDALQRIGKAIDRIIVAFGGATQETDTASEAAFAFGQILDAVVIAVQAVAIGVEFLARGFEAVADAIVIAKKLAAQFGQIIKAVGNKIPAILKPGSPPPLAVAMSDIGSASAEAAKMMQLFGVSVAKAGNQSKPLSKMAIAMDPKEQERRIDARRSKPPPKPKTLQQKMSDLEDLFGKKRSAGLNRVISNIDFVIGEMQAQVASRGSIAANLKNQSENQRFNQDRFNEAVEEFGVEFGADAKKALLEGTGNFGVAADFLVRKFALGEAKGFAATNVGITSDLAADLLDKKISREDLINLLQQQFLGKFANEKLAAQAQVQQQHMNLTINSSAPTENLAADFNMMKASMAPV
jgi:TP901 family phage tail tape measure protein